MAMVADGGRLVAMVADGYNRGDDGDSGDGCRCRQWRLWWQPEAMEAMVGVAMVAMGLEAWEYSEDMELDLLGLMEGGREGATKNLPD